jgi:hypothetical protein
MWVTVGAEFTAEARATQASARLGAQFKVQSAKFRGTNRSEPQVMVATSLAHGPKPPKFQNFHLNFEL